MIAKERIRKLEYPILFAYLGLWLLVYLLSRLCLEMYTDHTPGWVWIWLMVIFIPLSAYGALRMAYSEGGKWYHSFGYWVMFMLGSLFSGHYILLNSDILISSLIKPAVIAEAKVISVNKVMSRKLGFDHTAVLLQFNGKRIALDARPYTYFYLQNKTNIKITTGTSYLGNTYVTSTDMSLQAKSGARWLHLKDWAYRQRWLWVLFGFMVLVVVIKWKYFPDKPGEKRRPLSFWKAMGLIMGVLMALGLVLYLALLIYVKFFVSR